MERPPAMEAASAPTLPAAPDLSNRPKRRRRSPCDETLTLAERRARVFVLYVLERRSAPATAARLGIGSTTVYADLGVFKVKRRSQEEAQCPLPGPLSDLDSLSGGDWASVGKRVCQRREALRLSQRKLARLCGVDRSTIQKLEAGRLVPSVPTAERIAAELGATLAGLFGEPIPCVRCGQPTFVGYCQGHGPHHSGPVLSRRDRNAEADTLGSRLRDIRIARNVTLVELADRVGVRAATISSIENDHDLPSGELALALGHQLGFDALEFFDLKPCPCGKESCLTVGGRYSTGLQATLEGIARKACRASARELAVRHGPGPRDRQGTSGAHAPALGRPVGRPQGRGLRLSRRSEEGEG